MPVVEKLIKICQAHCFHSDTPTLSSSLEDLGFDSLDLLEFVMAIEDDFDIELHDEEIEQFTTLQSVFDVVEPRVNGSNLC